MKAREPPSRARQLSLATAQAYRQDYARFGKFVEPRGFTPENAPPSEVIAYIRSLADRGFSGFTIYRATTCIGWADAREGRSSRLLDRAVRVARIEVRCLPGFKPTPTATVSPVASDEQLRALAAVLAPLIAQELRRTGTVDINTTTSA